MARPKKQSIEYFTHPVKSSRTIEILERKFGANGYIFWFKLMEVLGDTPGHAYDCSDELNWLYIQSKALMDEDTASEIMAVLVRLGEVDRELWEQHRVIWVQSFVDSLADLYERRKSELPQRPNYCANNAEKTGVFRTETPDNGGFFAQKPQESGSFSHINRQSKVKYSKDNKENTTPSKECVVKENPAGFSPTDTGNDDKDVSSLAAAPPKADNGEPEQPKQRREPAFRPPTLEEVRARCREMDYAVDPEKFFDFYESKGWMVGKNRMKKWQCALANWARDGDYPPGGRAARAVGSSTAQPRESVLGMWERVNQRRKQNGENKV